MTQEEILGLARAAGWNIEHEQTNKMLIDFVALVSNREREACAQLCEDHFSSDGDYCAKQIRNRK